MRAVPCWGWEAGCSGGEAQRQVDQRRRVGSAACHCGSRPAPAGQPPHERQQRRGHHHARERGPDAVVDALAEAQLLTVVGPIDVEDLGVIPKTKASRLAEPTTPTTLCPAATACPPTCVAFAA